MAARLFSGFVTFFSGVAVILAVVFIVYVVAYFADRLVCMNSAALTAEEFEERRNASPLTVQAGLAGLLSVERNQIFHAFFERRAFPYYKSTLEEERKQDNVYEQQETDIEAQATIVAGDKKGKVSSKRGKGRSFVAYSKGMEQESLRDEANEAELDALSEDDVNAPACSICLNEYDDGDKVILGTGCSHMFHYGCCMQWVDKGNEYCPYCRATMITSRAFYETALQVVGEERVAKLERINAEAAARVAQLTASGTTTIASPVPPVGQPPAQLAAGSSDEGGTATEPRAVAPVSESQEAPSSSEPASPVNAATSGQGSNYVEPPRSSEEDAVAKSGQASSVAASANKDSDNHVESSRSSREDDIVAESEIVDEAPSRIGTIE